MSGEFLENTGTFKSGDGLNIFYRNARAPSERASLVIVHGLGEHSGRYGHVVDRLLPKGISIWALDHRGHGRSDGKRGHILSFGEYPDDVGSFLNLVRKDTPSGSKCFLLGHSMGGLIAIDFAIRHPQSVDGLITSSPGLGMRVRVPAIKSALGKIMSGIWPGLSLNNGLDATKISHDGKVVRAYESDPLVHDRVSARWFTEFLGAMERVNELAWKIEVPVLMQVAGDDRLVDANSSKIFFQKLTVSDKTLHFYDGLYHEIYNEAENQRRMVLTDLEQWLERHI